MRFNSKSVLASLVSVFLAAILIEIGNPSRLSAQANPTQEQATVSAKQQKDLDHLKQLGEQLQKDRNAVESAVNQHGWDSDQADAAQQQLFQDHQEYRILRRSLQSAGVAIPTDQAAPCEGCQNNCSGHCGSHGHGHHGCCEGTNDCSGHHDSGCCHGR